MTYSSCENCIHRDICKLREIREKLDNELSHVDLNIDPKIHVVSKCDKYWNESSSIVSSNLSPFVTWDSTNIATTTAK